MEKIAVFDALLFYGREYLQKPPTRSAAEELKLADAEQAVIVRNELRWLTPQRTIDLVNQMTAECPDVWGLYSMLPAVTGETKTVAEQCRTFREHRIAGYWLHPADFTMPCEAVLFEEELAECEKRKIPVWFRADGTNPLSFLIAILEKFHDLCVVLSMDVEWPDERKTYPLLRKYPNLFLCLSEEVWEGCLEDMVKKFGSGRFLYSSSWPRRYPGGTVMMVERGSMTGEDRQNIYGGNLRRLIGGMDCD